MPLSGMQSNGSGGVVPRIFEFSVIDPDVAEDVQEAMEKRQTVKLVYEEYFIKNQTAMGTRYEIIEVVLINQEEKK